LISLRAQIWLNPLLSRFGKMLQYDHGV
jgi:hypothetical protein